MRLSLKGIFLLITVVFFSCSQNDQPECLVSKTKMASILAELHLAEKEVELYNMKGDTTNIIFHSVFKKQALKKRNVEQKCFEESYEYYKVHLTDLSDIYKIVVDSLSLRESLIEAEHKKINQERNENQQN